MIGIRTPIRLGFSDPGKNSLDLNLSPPIPKWLQLIMEGFRSRQSPTFRVATNPAAHQFAVYFFADDGHLCSTYQKFRCVMAPVSQLHFVHKGFQIEAPQILPSRRKIRRVHFNPQVRQVCCLPQDTYWYLLLWRKFRNQYSIVPKEREDFLNRLFRAQKYGQIILPLPSVNLKPISDFDSLREMNPLN